MRALVVIDMQNDFVKPGGALYFTGAEEVIAPVVELVKEAKKRSELIITTQDWHEPDDAEFKIWQRHCVKNTEGAKIVEPLMNELKYYEKHIKIHKTRYSAFYGTNFDEILKEHPIDEVDLCGVVTHICVLFTAEELRNRQIPVKLHQKAVASYDDELHRCAIRMMKEVLNVEVV
ncbi:cysteine hydrolase family protein [Pseudothermotoga sp. U03pept]|uniref:cysteine hydrolase family protein n=1 Tax=Pseudothermotoga sp. U03pept TaxID=3447012 RepID=UPI003F027F0D